MKMDSETDESHFLLPFERERIHGNYRDYLRSKRNNYLANIDQNPDLWGMFVQIDGVWIGDLTALTESINRDKYFPSALYVNAHIKMRVAMELAFQSQMQEARSILRDAVEHVAHAHHMLKDPAHQVAWIEKDEPGKEQAYKKLFVDNKRYGVFDGLAELHAAWKRLSDTGSHATILGLTDRLRIEDNPTTQTMRMSYTGVTDLPSWVKETFTLMLTCYTMEKQLFDDYEAELQGNDDLTRVRNGAEIYKEQLRQILKDRYKIVTPATKPPWAR